MFFVAGEMIFSRAKTFKNVISPSNTAFFIYGNRNIK